MTPRTLVSTLVVTACTLGLGAVSLAGARAPAEVASSPRIIDSPRLASRVVAGPAPDRSGLTEDPVVSRRQGIEWLVKRQGKDGGWGAGNHGSDNPDAPSDVATTAVSVMALLRDAGDTDRHAEALERATLFIVAAIETAPEGARLATPTNTQPQTKLGSLVDTHLAALILGDLAPRFEGDVRARTNRAWDKVLGKVQLAQAADGSFANDGWAPVLAGSYAAQGLMKAKEAGRTVVEDEALDRAARYQASQVNEGGEFDTTRSAGVELYSVAGTLGANAKAAKRDGSASAPAAEAVVAQARTRVSGDSSGTLLAGFGSVGGEEMLAYTMISDTLAESGGDDWSAWEARINGYLTGIQNQDGSWSGHHCITSTTFVTATALMTLGAADHARLQATRATANEPSLR